MASSNLFTMHYSLNNGAVLQTFATCQVLKQLGHDVVVINFQDKERLRKFYGGLNSILFFFKQLLFNRFRKKYFASMTLKMNEIDEKKIPKADVYMVGSDQVWNQNITGKYLLHYFLDFAPASVEKMSFASSFGSDEFIVSSDFRSKSIALLQKFKSVSVREESGVEICKSLGVDAVEVLDPTLLLNHYELLLNIKVKPQNEIVCFTLSKQKDLKEIAILINSRLNASIRHINSVFPRRGFIYSYYLFVGVKKWLQYIVNSKFVITDSFHGVVFSLLFKKQFLVLDSRLSKGGITRIYSLLKKFDLEYRICSNAADVRNKLSLLVGEIDYEHVDSILKLYQNRTLDYLKRSI